MILSLVYGDNSLMNTIPDSWGISERFILCRSTKWYNDFTRVNIGGITCDNGDFTIVKYTRIRSICLHPEKNDTEPLYSDFSILVPTRMH